MSDEEQNQDWQPREGEEQHEEGTTQDTTTEPEAEEADLGSYLSQAWTLVSEEPMLFIVAFLVLFLLSAVSSIVVVGPLIIGGPLLFGYLDIIQKRIEGEPAEIGDVFGGFARFRKSLVTFLLIAAIGLGVGVLQAGAIFGLRLVPCLGSMIGYVLPAAVQVLLGAALFFVFPIAVFSDTSPTEAIGDSFAFCRENPRPTILLSLVTQVLASIGVVACGVGYFLTAPLAITMMVIAYNEYYVPNAPKNI